MVLEVHQDLVKKATPLEQQSAMALERYMLIST
jgi:hypothetical protein